jgi:high-affinity nickel-transport protein
MAAAGAARRLAVLYAGLALANGIAWAWALAVCRGDAVLLGAAMLAFVLGLRHAVDADHIAAIDNTTRKLMQRGERPLTVGLWFSLGHSTVVVLACAAVAVASNAVRARLAGLSGAGGVIGTGVSAGFLFLIALANLVALTGVWRAWRAPRAGTQAGEAIDAPGGPLWRLLRPLMAVIGQPWHMYPLGFLFGLGFDTASEIGLLAISAGEAAHHLPAASIMIFPALFTAGMTLVDTTDGVLMAGAYGWAFVEPRRKLAYNFAVTLVSVAIAIVVGAVEVLGLVGGRLTLAGWPWRTAAALNRHMGMLGAAIVCLLVACWAASIVLTRRNPPLERAAGSP